MQGPLEEFRQTWAAQVWANLQGPAVADRSTTAILDFDSRWVLEEWERELFERLLWQARGGSVRFVESTRGGGRSHFLLLLQTRARACGLATVFLPESRQAEVWRDPLELYRQIAANLMPNQAPAAAGFAAFVTATKHKEVARAELFPEFPTWGRALELWAESGSPAALEFLSGRSVPSEGEALGLHSGMTSGQALAATRALLQYLDFCGEKGLLVVSDGEGQVEPSQERSTLESLRNLIDACAGGDLPGMLLVFGVLPQFRLLLLPEYEALQQRLHNGLALGPAGCLRPILILEEQRRWRASQGFSFSEGVAESVLRLAQALYPDLFCSPALLRRNLDAMLAELPWDESTPGAARGLTRTIARWCAEGTLPLDSSEPDQHYERLERFLEEEAL